MKIEFCYWNHRCFIEFHAKWEPRKRNQIEFYRQKKTESVLGFPQILFFNFRCYKIVKNPIHKIWTFCQWNSHFCFIFRNRTNFYRNYYLYLLLYDIFFFSSSIPKHSFTNDNTEERKKTNKYTEFVCYRI